MTRFTQNTASCTFVLKQGENPVMQLLKVLSLSRIVSRSKMGKIPIFLFTTAKKDDTITCNKERENGNENI